MIELKPEHAAALADMLKGQATQEHVQIASLMASVEKLEALAARLSDGGRELDQTEIRLLADHVSGLDRMADVMPGFMSDAGRAALRLQLGAAKAKQDH